MTDPASAYMQTASQVVKAAKQCCLDYNIAHAAGVRIYRVSMELECRANVLQGQPESQQNYWYIPHMCFPLLALHALCTQTKILNALILVARF